MIRTVRMSDGRTKVTIYRISDDMTSGALPGIEAPEGRAVLIFAPGTLGAHWHRAIKERVRGFSEARWKVFGVDGRRSGAYLFRHFEPDLFTELPNVDALLPSIQ